MAEGRLAELSLRMRLTPDSSRRATAEGPGRATRVSHDAPRGQRRLAPHAAQLARSDQAATERSHSSERRRSKEGVDECALWLELVRWRGSGSDWPASTILTARVASPGNVTW